jgi:hypothetical protein
MLSRLLIYLQRPLFVLKVYGTFFLKGFIVGPIFEVADSQFIMGEHAIKGSSCQMGVFYVGIGQDLMAIEDLAYNI